MKKILFAAIAMLFTTGIVCAQDDQINASSKAAPSLINADLCDMTDCYILKNNQVFHRKNGVETLLTAEATLNNGSVVLLDGTIQLPDGTPLPLKNSECIDVNGKICTISDLDALDVDIVIPDVPASDQ